MSELLLLARKERVLGLLLQLLQGHIDDEDEKDEVSLDLKTKGSFIFLSILESIKDKLRIE
ncbi:hypothetical protein Leryth_006742 [Lithospermum erythrorhizon]|nr:hypothetical protein Leryth_006742 [Lithospermum erythrorhizon]